MEFLKMKIKEFNCETGVEIERDATEQEIAQAVIDAANAREELAVKIAANEKRALLLEKLGITEEEAKLLLGGN
jgi:hypothetical protein